MRQSKNRPSAFQAGCSKRRLNLALVFCLFCVIFVFLVFCVSWYFGVIVILCCQYLCSWLRGKTVTEMTYYVLTGMLNNGSLTHSLTVVIVPAVTATDHYVLHMFFIYIVLFFHSKHFLRHLSTDILKTFSDDVASASVEVLLCWNTF